MLIEIIIALSVFAITAAAVTQSFLVNLQLQRAASTGHNDAIVKMILINRIKLANVSHGQDLRLPLYYEGHRTDNEIWTLKVKPDKNPIKWFNHPTGMYYLKVTIQKNKEGEENYEIFHHVVQ